MFVEYFPFDPAPRKKEAGAGVGSGSRWTHAHPTDMFDPRRRRGKEVQDRSEDERRDLRQSYRAHGRDDHDRAKSDMEPTNCFIVYW